MNEQQLGNRFAELWQRCAIHNTGHAPAWEDIYTRYREPTRCYHDLGHLAHCMEELDAAGDRIEEPEATELAIWFHDIIYRYGAKDNEELSALNFRDAARAHMPESLVKRVSNFIVATKHIGEAPDTGCAFMVDIDLSGFGLPWEGYLADSLALRDEAASVTDAQYYQGKLRFLAELIGRSCIFQTDYFRDRLEQQARENISRYMQQIRSEGLDQ